MNCLTPEQLAQLGRADDASLSTHVEQCDACRTALAETNQLVAQLSSAHAIAILFALPGLPKRNGPGPPPDLSHRFW